MRPRSRRGGTLSGKTANKLDIEGGVKVKNLYAGKLRKYTGMQEGFIITKIDSKKVNTPQEIVDLLKDRSGGVLIEGIYPNGMKGYYGFGL